MMVGYLARIELRRRWRSVLLLTALVAVVTAVVLTTVAGSRRARTSYDRFLEGVNPTDAAVFGDEESSLDAVAGLPHVVDSARVEMLAMSPRESDAFLAMLVSLDGLLPGRYMQPMLLEGRMPRPEEPLAIAVGERVAAEMSLRVGDVLPMVGYTSEAAQALGGPDEREADGPLLDLEVVGLVREPGDITGRASDFLIVYLTPAFRDRYPSSQVGVLGAGSFVVLDDPARLEEFSAAAAALGGLQVDSSQSVDATRAQAQPTMDAIATALLVVALAAGLAGLAAIGQAASRSAQPALADDPTLAALGASRWGRWARLVAPPSVGVAAGAVLGVVLAVAASPLMPIGLARRAEPSTGVDIDGAVLGGGFVIALLAGWALVAGTIVLSARTRASRQAGARPSNVAGIAAEAGASPSVVIGLRLAADGRSASTVASRAALLGAALGVLGLVAAVIFASSVDRIITSPALYGWGWDANVAGSDLSDLSEETFGVAAMLDDDDVAAVAEAEFNIAAFVDGRPAYAMALDDRRGHVSAVMVDGRQPSALNEVALGATTLAESGRLVGDRIAVDLGEGAQDMEITGVVVLPVSEDGGSSSSGLLMTGAAARELASNHCDEQDSCYRNVAVDLIPGADPEAVLAPYLEDVQGAALDLPEPPGEVQRLVAVESLPWYLAAFLAVLAGVAIAHGASSAVRRRSHDLAVLRVLGLTSSQVRTAVSTQVLALSAAGALAGAAAGWVIGRQVWRAVAESVPLPYSPASPAAITAGIVVVTVLLAQLGAIHPRRAAARLRPVDVLRAE
jgi:hypothetical protein